MTDEPPQRNAGILGGKFMERTRCLLPGSSLTDVDGPKYYKSTDLFVGTTLEILKQNFVLLDADEFVYQYMEDKKEEYKYADIDIVSRKLVKGVGRDAKVLLEKLVKGLCSNGTELIDRTQFLDATSEIWQSCLTRHVR